MGQFRLNSTIANALWAALLACWVLPASAVGELRIVTEDFPPFSMQEGGKVTGAATEVVEAVLKEVGLRASIQVMPWARAYDIALNSENVLIYSITHNASREPLFKWVGEITPTHTYLFSLRARNIQLKQLDDARKYQVGTVNEDAGEQYLVSEGFAFGKNLQSSNKDELIYEKLKLGRVDLWLADEMTAPYVVRRAGDDPAKILSRVLYLRAADAASGEMAFSLQTPDALVERFRKALETVKKNGTYDRIQKNWLR